jgi:hypothetical protein
MSRDPLGALRALVDASGMRMMHSLHCSLTCR